MWSPFAIAVGRVTITRQIYEYTYDGPERAVRSYAKLLGALVYRC